MTELQDPEEVCQVLFLFVCEPDLEAPHELILPMELKLDGQIARMFSTVTTVATPHDVTLQELHVEVFYPADVETEAVLQSYEERTKTRLK